MKLDHRCTNLISKLQFLNCEHLTSQFLTYQDTLYFILNYVLYQNNIGNYYPVWCTCMSFEMSAIYFTENIRLKKQEDFKKYLTSAGNIGQDVINYAQINRGALVVAAVGNDNTENRFYC